MKSHKLLFSLGLLSCGVAVLFVMGASASRPQSSHQQRGQQGEAPRLKTLREVGHERDVEIPIPDLEHNNEYTDLRGLTKDAQVIIIGRITNEESSFKGDHNIITTYTVNIQRVLKQTVPRVEFLAQDELPTPITQPFRFFRDGGVMYVNGHHVSRKLKGSELLSPGNDYILFLGWAPNFKAYGLMGGSSGAFLIKETLRVQPLGSKKELKLKYENTDLATFIQKVLGFVN